MYPYYTYAEDVHGNVVVQYYNVMTLLHYFLGLAPYITLVDGKRSDQAEYIQL